jgi:hypothetical protein
VHGGAIIGAVSFVVPGGTKTESCNKNHPFHISTWEFKVAGGGHANRQRLSVQFDTLTRDGTRNRSDKYKCDGTLGETERERELWRNASRPSAVSAAVFSPRGRPSSITRKREETGQQDEMRQMLPPGCLHSYCDTLNFMYRVPVCC